MAVNVWLLSRQHNALDYMIFDDAMTIKMKSVFV